MFFVEVCTPTPDLLDNTHAPVTAKPKMQLGGMKCNWNRGSLNTISVWPYVLLECNGTIHQLLWQLFQHPLGRNLMIGWLLSCDLFLPSDCGAPDGHAGSV